MEIKVFLTLRKKNINSLFSKVRFIYTFSKYTNLSKDGIKKIAYEIDSNEEKILFLVFEENKLNDFLYELSEQNLNISTKFEERENVHLSIDKIKAKYFEGDEIQEYCIDESDLLIHKPTGSVIIIENDSDFVRLKKFISRCPKSY